ncbi:MAG: hypothetical protein IIW48_02335 [Clostridia bacterium]|nr:hypothetical protein [Clostridia bacterium]
MLVLNFNMVITDAVSRGLWCAGAVAAVLGAVLLCCARTAKDKWYASILYNSCLKVEEIIVSFSLRDFFESVVFSLVSIAYSLVRIVGFFAFPAAFAAATCVVMGDGVSRKVLAVMLLGNVLFFVCASFFCGVSLNCISLSRSACVGNIGSFRAVLKKLECCSLRIFAFDIFLSVTNRSSRRLAKLIFAQNICEENKETFFAHAG